MANIRKSGGKKPRVRKVPTLREQAEAKRAEQEKVELPKRRRKIRSKAAAFLTKSRLTRNPITKILARVGRIILKVLRWLVPKYFVNAWREVRQVTWPNRRETWRLTGAVFIFAIVFGALVSGVDKVLDIIFKHVVLK